MMIISVDALAVVYRIDPAHSSIEFKVRHLGVVSVTGKFKKFSGSGDIDEQTGDVKNASVLIQVASIDTNEPDRDKHLRSSDFFDVKTHPNIRFEITKVIFQDPKVPKIPTHIRGKLTIRGVTKDIELTVTEWGGRVLDPWENERFAFEANGEIDRREFGLNWNQSKQNPFTNTLIWMVGNEVKLRIAVEAVKVVSKAEKPSKTEKQKKSKAVHQKRHQHK